MADNVTVTQGSGTSISTEEVTTLNGGAVSAQHVQRVVPAMRTADGTASDLACGAGAVSTSTLRVTSASDDPLVTRMAGAAHDAAVAGNPHRIGARAVSANYAAVATGDTADAIATLVGALITRPYTIPEGEWSYVAASGGIDNTATAVTVKTAAGAGLRNYITGLDIAHAPLGATTELAIRDGAGGTVLWRTVLHTTALPLTSVRFPVPLKGTANTLLEVVTLTAVTGDVLVNMQGYAAP